MLTIGFDLISCQIFIVLYLDLSMLTHVFVPIKAFFLSRRANRKETDCMVVVGVFCSDAIRRSF